MSRAMSAVAAALGAAFTLGLLAACGGGNDAPPPITVPTGLRDVAASADADLNPANFERHADALARVVGLTTGNPLVVQPLSAGREQPLARRASAPVPASLLGVAVQAWVAQPQVWHEQRASVAAGTGAQVMTAGLLTVPCPGGGWLTVGGDDADLDGLLSAGDSLSIEAYDCAPASGAAVLEGAMSIVFTAVELDAGGMPQALGGVGKLTALRVGGFGAMTGPFRLRLRNEAASASNARVEYQALTITREGDEPLRLDLDVYTLGALTGDHHLLSGGLTVGGRTFSVVAAEGEPLWMSRGAGLPGSFSQTPGDRVPSAGRVGLRDAAGDTLWLRARSGELMDFELRPAGATAPSAVLTDVPWSRYRGGP